MTAVAPHAEPAVRTRALSLDARLVLAGIVVASFAVRLAFGLLKATPLVFPDEYIYSAISRSIAETGKPLIRGHAAHFPALLASLLTAPAWLAHNTEAAYRIALTLGAAAMSLAAVPAFALARRAGLASGAALGVAALALLLPDLTYTAALLAEPFAYPLALAAFLTGIAALERPSARRQLLLLVVAGLATFARVQFAALPLAYVLAAAVVAGREGRIRRALREQAPILALLGVGAVGIAVVGLGYYQDILHLSLAPGGLLRAAGANLYVAIFASGVVLVPGALLGLGLGIARPRERRELVFCAFTAAVGLATWAEATLYGEAAHERYTFYLFPLLAIAFLLYARRGWPLRRVHGLLVAVVALLALRVPLTLVAVKGETNSAFLIALHWLANHVGGTANASLAAALTAVAALGLLVALAWLRPARAAVAGLVLAGVICGAAYAAVADFDRRNSEVVRASMFTGDRQWVDHAAVGSVPLIQAYGGEKTDALNQLFWNRSLDRIAYLPGGGPVDVFATTALDVARDGTLLVHGKPLRGDVVVDGYGSLVELRDGRVLASARNYDLWRTGGTARLALYFTGRYRDTWTSPRSQITLWPASGDRVAGTLTLRVDAPGAMRAYVQLPQGGRRSFALGDAPQTLSVPVCGRGRVHLKLAFSRYGFIDDRVLAVRSGVPHFRSDPAACR